MHSTRNWNSRGSGSGSVHDLHTPICTAIPSGSTLLYSNTAKSARAAVAHFTWPRHPPTVGLPCLLDQDQVERWYSSALHLASQSCGRFGHIWVFLTTDTRPRYLIPVIRGSSTQRIPFGGRETIDVLSIPLSDAAGGVALLGPNPARSRGSHGF